MYTCYFLHSAQQKKNSTYDKLISLEKLKIHNTKKIKFPIDSMYNILIF